MKTSCLIGLSCLLAAAVTGMHLREISLPAGAKPLNYLCYEDISASPAGDSILDRDQARQYMLDLINRDRASVGAPPVVMDQTATRAGDLHTDEMAEFGYLSHWTLDGRKPDQRYTECGGKDAIAENADATHESNPQKMPLCRKPVFTKHDLDEVESQLFNEQPPNDGHRINIVAPHHTAVGIGLSMAGVEPVSDGNTQRIACTQEFVNHYGNYSDIPLSLDPGDRFVVAGTLAKDVHIQSVDLRREKLPEPMTIEQLDKTYSYGIPEESVCSYFPPPYQSPAPVIVTSPDGYEHFSLEIQTTRQWHQGLYYVCLWANIKDRKSAVMISTRTIKIGSPRSKSPKRDNKQAGPDRTGAFNIRPAAGAGPERQEP